MSRYWKYGDRRHWEFSLGLLNFSRWCPGAPCGFPDVLCGRHWVRVRLWRRAWSRRYESPPVHDVPD